MRSLPSTEERVATQYAHYPSAIDLFSDIRVNNPLVLKSGRSIFVERRRAAISPLPKARPSTRINTGCSESQLRGDVSDRHNEFTNRFCEQDQHADEAEKICEGRLCRITCSL